MPTHSQDFCNRCQRPTLHIADDPYRVPHLGHFVAVVVLFLLAIVASPILFGALTFLWLLVWFTHAAVNIFTRTPPARCTQCGEKAGPLTFRQLREERDAASPPPPPPPPSPRPRPQAAMAAVTQREREISPITLAAISAVTVFVVGFVVLLLIKAAG